MLFYVQSDFYSAAPRFEYPIRSSSTSLAAFLPSRIAQTTRNCPGAYRPPCRFPEPGLLCPSFFVFYPETPVAPNPKPSAAYFSAPRISPSVNRIDVGVVPRFHHCCVIAVEILYLLPHIAVMFPRRRDRDHDSQRKIHAAHGKEFQRVGDSLPYFHNFV